jgi:Ca-activated chloride channel family protein
MKLKHVGFLALLGMMGASVSVSALTNGERRQLARPGLAEAATTAQPTIAPTPVRIQANATLHLGGRLSHTALKRHTPGKAYLLLEVRGGDVSGSTRSPVKLALVLDRSGSMSGDRMQQAKAAARGVVERMRDGDTVTVVSFDTSTQVVVPPTVLSSERSELLEAIDSITLGGDTCVSCGIETAMTQLGGIREQPAHVIVLSDGKTNHGLRGADDLRKLASSCGKRGVGITTVGVGLDYEEEKLAAIAEASNGEHHFVENTASLPALFEAEAKRLAATVATDAKLSIALDEGVRVSKVFDRDYREIDGSRLEVSLGALARGELKTVLVELDVPTAELGSQAVATVKLTYGDEVTRGLCELEGALGIDIDDVGQPTMDPVVQARLERSLTSTALEQANVFLRRGEVARARARIEQREQQLRQARAAIQAAPKSAPMPGVVDRSAEVQFEFDDQLGSTHRAQNDLKKKKKGRKGGCGCSGSDLMCNTRCSQKRNGAEATKMKR